MIKNLSLRLVIILVITAISIWIDASSNLTIRNPIDDSVLFTRNVSPRLGLDLRGGVQVLMEADLPEGSPALTAENMEVARGTMENRTNALGVSENSIQVAGNNRIVGEFPGVQDVDSLLATIQQTGMLEFIDTGLVSLPEGTVVVTDYAVGGASAPTADGSDPTAVVYHTIMTGGDLKTQSVSPSGAGGYQIDFTLTDNGAKVFATHTAANVGKYLTIVLDKKVISSPRIDSAIPSGQGTITGAFSYEEANRLVTQLRYGSLPIPLKIVETRIIGPTLGQDSLDKSLRAGIIGMIIVALFMLLYYRLPGMVADVSIIIYALIAFALFKYIPVTLTLAGVAGFLISTGSALDANILIFERIKEELRNGRTLDQAFDLGWVRARPAIFDSNIATLLTSAILFWFGSTFGATIVKGFALTLFMGVGISLFSAIFVTRSLLALVLRTFKPKNITFWFGL